MNTDPRLIAFARQMRHEPAPAEKLMWRLLRNRRLAGFRFRRQEPIEPYIADFYCAVAGLVIELDGDTHVGMEEADRIRQEYLESRSLRVLRFWNVQLYEDADGILEAVYLACLQETQNNSKVSGKIDEWGYFQPTLKQEE